MFTTLVSTATLAAHLDDPAWIICDCRHDLADPGAGRSAFGESHIPGARFVHLDEDLSAVKTGRNGRHPLPDPGTFARRLGELGISNASQVVAYDASGGYYAARLWWMLRWVGHEAAAVLDGGWDHWVRAGRPVTDLSPQFASVDFVPQLQPGLALDVATLAATPENKRPLLVDARSPDRFRGENETLDPVAGHIPGATNRFFKSNLAADGRFRPAADLAAEFTALLPQGRPAGIAHYCGSGVTACHNLLAMEIAGLHGSRLYPGSWSEWCSDPARPVATG